MSHPFTTCSSHDVVRPTADTSFANSSENSTVSPNAASDTTEYVVTLSPFTGLVALPSPVIYGLELVDTFKPPTRGKLVL